MSRARIELNEAGEFQSIAILCPGCKWYGGKPMEHYLNVKCPDGLKPSTYAAKRPIWTWNGSLDRPTFSPSFLEWCNKADGTVISRCHSFIRDGRIEFLSDCTHALKGQTVDLPEIPDNETD